MSWKSEIIGSGRLTIQEIVPGKYIESKLESTSPRVIQSKDIWKFESVNGRSNVTWINEAELSYPVECYFGFFIDSMLGGDFESGLANLKILAENKYNKLNELLIMDRTLIYSSYMFHPYIPFSCNNFYYK